MVEIRCKTCVYSIMDESGKSLLECNHPDLVKRKACTEHPNGAHPHWCSREWLICKYFHPNNPKESQCIMDSNIGYCVYPNCNVGKLNV